MALLLQKGGSELGYLQLDGDDWRQIRETLESSFTVPALGILVQQDFPDVYDEVPWMGLGKVEVVFNLIRVANQHGRLDGIIAAAAAQRPYRSDLRSLTLYYSRRPGWTVTTQANGLDIAHALEALTSTGNPFLDTSRLAFWLIAVERQVCQVRCGSQLGTGFLIGSDLVMTCYHVVEQHLKQQVDASNVQVRFDYRRSPAGAEPMDASLYWIRIDPDWKIPSSPYSQADITLQGEPKETELDYAVLKLTEPAGSTVPPGEQMVRGWIDLSKSLSVPEQSTAILIVQHPGAAENPPTQMPLQIAFATPGFESLNSNSTRISYKPSTKKGSSGSPVFDCTLGAVALHHNRGQIDPNAADLAKNNRGIPLDKIIADLRDDVRALLKPPPAIA
jgi:hypothetical protein